MYSVKFLFVKLIISQLLLNKTAFTAYQISTYAYSPIPFNISLILEKALSASSKLCCSSV